MPAPVVTSGNSGDDKHTCLLARTGETEGHTDDLESLWLRTQVGGPPADVNDLWLRYFWLQGAVSLDYNDAAVEYLTGLGYTGALTDQWDQFWEACPIPVARLSVATTSEPDLDTTLDRQSLETLALMEKRKLAQENLILNQHRIYDAVGIPRGGSLEDRHALYTKAGHAPGVKIELVKIRNSEYQPPEELSSVTEAEYGCVHTGFREPIREMVWDCEGGTITKQPSMNRVIVETDSDKDTEITLTAHATSERREATGKQSFTHKHTQLQPPAVSIKQVEPGLNGYRPPNKKSRAATTYTASTEHFRKPLRHYEWAVEGAEIIEGQGTAKVTIETYGTGEVDFVVHLVVEDIYGTAEFKHSHPKLPSFAVLKKQHEQAENRA
jgi:hypothetical protein